MSEAVRKFSGNSSILEKTGFPYSENSPPDNNWQSPISYFDSTPNSDKQFLWGWVMGQILLIFVNNAINGIKLMDFQKKKYQTKSSERESRQRLSHSPFFQPLSSVEEDEFKGEDG